MQMYFYNKSQCFIQQSDIKMDSPGLYKRIVKSNVC